MRRAILRLTICSAICLSGCLRAAETERYTFIDMEAVVRLAEPTPARILVLEDGEWIEGGTGELPAGAYVRGRKPAPRGEAPR